MLQRSLHCVLSAFISLFLMELNLAAEMPQAQSQTLRVLTYNIHHGEGVDGKLDLVRIANVIRDAEPDVVALQEVDRNTERTGRVDQAAQLGQLLGMHVAFGANIKLQGGEYGNAILSRWPIEEQANYLLPCFDQGEQRGVLEGVIRSPYGLIRLLSTHLDHRRDPAERLASIRLLSLTDETTPEAMRTESRMSLPTLLAGDLNTDWESEAFHLALVDWSVPQTESLPTIPVGEPSKQIDFVLYRPASRWKTVETRVLSEAIASDHRALLTTLELVEPPFPGTVSQWNGFDRYDFNYQSLPITVVVPKVAVAGRPWVWHGEFFGHKPAPDIALLERGFHIVYVSLPDLLGSPIAVAHWNRCYELLTERYQLSKQVALVGLSRGGLYCYNWALANPDKVACIYGDAPVCDFKSWPGGKGVGPGDRANWERVLKLWDFKDEAAALEYRGNPVDRLEPLAAAKVPLLHVFGDADEVVPWEENTGLVADRYRALGGSIELIRKAGVKHHPHGLDDSTPIVDFILRHTIP